MLKQDIPYVDTKAVRIIGITFLVIIGVIYLTRLAADRVMPDVGGNPSRSSETQAQVQEDTTPNSETAQRLMPVGAVGQVWNADPAWVLIARTKEAHEEIDKAIAARDTDGLMELVREGMAFQADSGTKVKVIETDWFHGLTRIRILSGPHSRESGWLYSQLVVP